MCMFYRKNPVPGNGKQHLKIQRFDSHKGEVKTEQGSGGQNSIDEKFKSISWLQTLEIQFLPQLLDSVLYVWV